MYPVNLYLSVSREPVRIGSDTRYPPEQPREVTLMTEPRL